MKRFAVAGTLLVAGFAGVLIAQDKMLKELEGTYKVTSLEKAGKTPPPKELIESMRFTFKGDELTIKYSGDEKKDQEKKAKIKVDGTKIPATIDITPTEGDEKGKTFPGIVKVEKGEVTIVFTEGGDRPKEFKAEGDAVLIKLKKEEKEKK